MATWLTIGLCYNPDTYIGFLDNMFMKKTELIYFLILVFSTSLMSCTSVPSKQIIAHNKDKTTQLTETELEKWLVGKKQLKYQDKQLQIESYFVQKALLNKQKTLSKDVLLKYKFLNSLKSYSKAQHDKKKEVYSKITIDEEQTQNLFESYKINYLKRKPKVRLYQIYKRYPPNATEQEKKNLFQNMLSIKNQITDLESFKKIATLESNSQTRLRGGLVGNIKDGTFGGDLNKIVMSMQKGEISDVISGTSGLVLFYCEKTIPVVEKTDKVLRANAYSQLYNYEAEKQWQNYKTDIINQLKISLNFDLLNSTDNEVIVATSIKHKLTKQQLSWLTKLNKDSKNLSNYKKELLTNTVSNYFFSLFVFENLTVDEQNKMMAVFKPEYNQVIISEVLSKLINSKFSPPTKKDIREYYEQTKNKYEIPESYDLSVLALKISENNKLKVYKDIELLHHKIISHQLDFNKASKDFSALNHIFPNGKISKIHKSDVASKLGINLSQQIQQMSVADISDIVESDSGYFWLIKLDSIYAAHPASFQEAKEIAHKKLGEKILDEIKEEIIDDVLQSEEITILNYTPST